MESDNHKQAFAYVFNTPKEDHRVAKVLSGMPPKQASILPSLDLFDRTRQEHIYKVRNKLLSSSYAMGNPAFNVGTAAANIFTTVTIYHYPSMVKVNLTGPAISASCHLGRPCQIFSHGHSIGHSKQSHSKQNKAALDHRRALIEKLLGINCHLEARLSSIEDMHNKTLQGTSKTEMINTRRSQPKLRKAYHTTRQGINRQEQEIRLKEVMKFFLPIVYALDKKADNCKDHVKQVGMKPQLISKLTFARTTSLHLEAVGLSIQLLLITKTH
ncbi:hypothetical protein PHMEG_00027312 [Phytophthora megakarya]|uniref:Uncharacterized protein n=1 Tax=Phytophthora megakarya TaxID=4795 RepID=A0A225V630_9STRA|nr:hypothetical protein PHMEG_00027312 [Phytophthora megakarya]